MVVMFARYCLNQYFREAVVFHFAGKIMLFWLVTHAHARRESLIKPIAKLVAACDPQVDLNPNLLHPDVVVCQEAYVTKPQITMPPTE